MKFDQASGIRCVDLLSFVKTTAKTSYISNSFFLFPLFLFFLCLVRLFTLNSVIPTLYRVLLISSIKISCSFQSLFGFYHHNWLNVNTTSTYHYTTHGIIKVCDEKKSVRSTNKCLPTSLALGVVWYLTKNCKWRFASVNDR